MNQALGRYGYNRFENTAGIQIKRINRVKKCICEREEIRKCIMDLIKNDQLFLAFVVLKDCDEISRSDKKIFCKKYLPIYEHEFD